MNSDPLTKNTCQCKRKKHSDTKNRLVRDYCSKYVLSDDDLKKFQVIFLTEIKNGLAKATHDNADVKCHITYVTELPNGTEKGKYLALDLGGTNFRVLLVDLLGDNKYEMKSKIYAIPTELMTDSGDELFNLIVDCIADFIDVYTITEYSDTIGFTFSFPVNQLGLQNGILVRWTKGFNCTGVVGENVVDLLFKALKKKSNIIINTIALLNDTTGTLMSCALENSNCKIGLIVGTGSNGCYMENVTEVENWDTSKSNATHVIINCEFGAFGENGCIDFLRTNEDKYIDLNSLNVGQQFLEKMISGMYMGEMVRLIMIQLVRDKLLFDGNSSDVLEERDGFKTLYLSEIESDIPGEYINLKRILKEMRLDKYITDDDCDNVFYICQCISRRSAHLVSAAIATLINKIGDKTITVGVDGTVYRLHPHYHNLMVEKIQQLINPGITFNIVLSDDGSGKGAAIIAAVAARTKE